MLFIRPTQVLRGAAKVWLLLAGMACLAPMAHAQEPFPTRAVKIVVSAPPGGLTDVLARLMADGLSKRWNQAVVVENLPGAGQTIGTAKVAQSPPDGYTLHVAHHATFTRKFYYTNINYDPTTLTPLVLLGESAYGLATRPDFPANNLRELIDYAKAHPGKVSLGVLGMGGDSHVRMVTLGLRNGVEFTQVQYRGESDLINALAGGHLDVSMFTLSTVLSIVPRIKVIAVTSAERNSDAKDVATLAESGLRDFVFGIRYFLVGPAGMSPALQKKINADAAAVMATPQVRTMLATIKFTPSSSSTLEFARETAAFEIESYRRILAESKLEPQK